MRISWHNRETIHVRHQNVGNYRIDGFTGQHPKRFDAIASFDRIVAFRLKHHAKQLALVETSSTIKTFMIYRARRTGRPVFATTDSMSASRVRVLIGLVM